jgi:hypothetical protein
MSLASILSEHLIQPFVRKPGMNLSKSVVERALTVEETIGGKNIVDHFVQSASGEVRNAKGVALNMMPVVDGGLQEGDIVLRGSSPVCMAEGGIVGTIQKFLKEHHWVKQTSEVSHSGIVVKNADGEMRVIHMVSGSPPEGTEQYLTKLQKKFKATYLRNETPEQFFNVKGEPSTQSTVMRHPDARMAKLAAKKAQRYFDTQLTATEQHPWYSKLPHSLAPDGRGGVCSTFVDLMYGEHFQYASHLPTTPYTFASSPELKQVADRSITQIEALKK